ncbi:MAG: ATP-dependent acyl-CoA ligase [Hyphomicrobiales bacterium]|nr:MAG: ATP-dependent acyl-CoA ligase [Hyphomicrobiales bacterium]
MTAAKPNSVFEAFAATAQRFGDRPFLNVLPETAAAYGIAAGEITYVAMLEAAQALAAAYAAQGVGHGQRVGLLLQNRPAFFEHWLALNAIGVSVVPINPDLRASELEYVIAHSEMVAAVATPERVADLARAAAAGGRDVSIFTPDEAIPRIGGPIDAKPASRETECGLLYTSGTTSRPKGCVLTNTYYLNSAAWYLEAGGLMAMREGSERMLTPLPLFHMNAMAFSAVTMMLCGGCLSVLDRFHPKTWWDSVRQSQATIIHYLGVMPPMLMGAPASADDRAHRVRFGFGAGVDRGLHAAFEARFGFPLIEAWAMTETGGGVVIAASQEPRHVGTNCFGKPGPEAEVRVVDEADRDVAAGEPGELLVRRSGSDPRHGFLREYLKDPAATAEAWAGDWFHTGDVVRQNADGTLCFVDRRKNVIRRSGENISAVEVESVLQRHPAIAAVAVAAAPDAVRGDEVFALIVAREAPKTAEARAALAREIVDYSLAQLAYYKAPGFIAFVDALPLTSTQKIQRGALKDLVGTLLQGSDVIDMRALKKRAA